MRKSLLAGVAGGFAVVLLAATPSFAAVTANASVPDAISVFVPCANGGAGEVVNASGDLHILSSFTVNANNVSGDFHFQPQGISGTGSITGDKYQGTGVTQSNFDRSLQNGQFSQTFINNFRIIGQGPGNNFLVHQTLHITLNANGVVTAIVANTSTECK
jgi:hypothetical protein